MMFCVEGKLSWKYNMINTSKPLLTREQKQEKDSTQSVEIYAVILVRLI